MTPFLAQLRAEAVMTLRRGESVLLTLGIPVILLVFFSTTDVLPKPDGPSVDFLAPGILGLAVMSSAFVGVAIATAFERQYGVLKRIGTTPLGRPRLLIAKIAAVLVVQLVQTAVLVVVAMLLGWRPELGGLAAAVVAVLIGTSAFAGFALVIAGRQRAEMVLASANGLYMVLLLLSGMLFPITELPGLIRNVAKVLPSTALTEILRGTVGTGVTPSWAWPVLFVWAIAAPASAARMFRWE